MSEKRYVALGEVARPHGIKGELRINARVDSPAFFDSLQAVWLGRDEKRPRRHRLLSWRLHQGAPLLTLEGVPDRNAAELLRGLLVLVPAEDLPEPAEDEVYLHELEGAAVLVAPDDPEGEPVPLGVLENFFEAGGQETWSIRTPDGREVLFPVAEEFIESIDEESGEIVISPPPGLIELYLGDAGQDDGTPAGLSDGDGPDRK